MQFLARKRAKNCMILRIFVPSAGPFLLEAVQKEVLGQPLENQT
jgi:hypothetical protein